MSRKEDMQYLIKPQTLRNKDYVTISRNEYEQMLEALEIANEAITISANQLEGIGLAFTTHGTNLNVKFMIENSYENARQAREAQKQIQEIMEEK